MTGDGKGVEEPWGGKDGVNRGERERRMKEE